MKEFVFAYLTTIAGCGDIVFTLIVAERSRYFEATTT